MTTSKSQKKRPAPLAPRKKAQKPEPTETKTPEAETPTAEPETVQEAQTPEAAETTPETVEAAPAEGFSSAEAQEITEDLGVEEEVPAESDTAVSDEPEGTPEDGPGDPAQDEQEAAHNAEIIYLAECEKKSKDIFYKILCGGFDVGNKIASKGQPEGPYTSLDLKRYGPVGREASDQFFDRMAEVPFIKRFLFKLGDNVIVEKWGAVMMLAFSVNMNFKAELEARLKERSLKSEAEKPLKEKAKDVA